LQAKIQAFNRMQDMHQPCQQQRDLISLQAINAFCRNMQFGENRSLTCVRPRR